MDNKCSLYRSTTDVVIAHTSGTTIYCMLCEKCIQHMELTLKKAKQQVQVTLNDGLNFGGVLWISKN